MAKMTKTDIMMREILNAGNQPNFGALNFQAANFQSDYMQALNWIHHNVEVDTLRTELETMLSARPAGVDAALIAQLNGVQVSLLGKIAYCVNRGAQLAPTSILRVTRTLSELRSPAAPSLVAAPIFEEQVQTAAGRINEIYKACYSRIDNIRARVLAGKTTLDGIQDEVRAVLDAQGARAQVRKRLVEHYTQNLQEALADKVLKTWVKPLQAIVTTLGGDVKAAKEKVAKVAAKEKVVSTKAKEKVKAKAVKGTKARAAKGKETVAKVRKTRTVTIKAPTAKQEQGQPSVASQVRDLIRVNKNNTDEQGMIELVINKLGLSKERGRSVVRAFWNKVEVS